MRFELLGISTATELPAAPADFVLVRFTIEPDDPSVALASVESRALTARVEAPIHVTRAALIAAFATPGAGEEVTGPEEVAAGTEFTLEAGDSAFFPPNVEGEIRNDGEEPAVALVAIVAPPEAAGGTPTP
ncbi:MAG: cupin domain-containing protein [Chloroflexota bacterium]|nr:cupin domain-containing protein [Chloroflexota bacterium]